MITCQLKGGLGNQLFQLCATMAFAMKHDRPFVFWAAAPCCPVTYWNTLLAPLRPFVKDHVPPAATVLEEQDVAFNADRESATAIAAAATVRSLPRLQVLELRGYFQSYRYFDEQRERILKWLRWQPPSSVANNDSSFAAVVSLHVRLGDYKQHAHIYTQLSHPDCTYYEDALHHATTANPAAKAVLCFCDEPTDAGYVRLIERLRARFPGLNFEQAEAGGAGSQDWEQLMVMSQCGQHILANSTFSWWAAYLGNPSLVCFPKQWFCPSVEKNIGEMCPAHWVAL